MSKKISLKLIIFNILIMASIHAVAQDAITPCVKKDGSTGLKELEKFDCKLVEAIVNEPKIKSTFQKKVNDTLAKKLYTNASQRLEELALLDSYFEQIGLDLSLSSKEVTSKCRLELIANPKCGAGTSSQNYQERLKFFLSKFPESTARNTDGSRNFTLPEKMRARSAQIRGVGIEKVDNCPAVGSTGYFLLNSQFSEDEAKKFIIELKRKTNDRFLIDRFYVKLPQFQILNDVKKLGGAGSSFLDKFENAMKNYDVSNGSPKKFIEKFFFTPETQQQLAKSLANKCEAIATNIKDYLCNDFDHLGMSEDLAAAFFNDENSKVDIQIARGFSCGLINLDANELGKKNVMTGSTVGALDAKLNEDIRFIPSATDINKIVAPFCEMYNCKNTKMKTLNSCQKGGPLASDDLKKYCIENKCDRDEMKYISFLNSLERDNEKTSNNLQSLASNSNEAFPDKNQKGYSSFYQNFLGVEGVLLTEGKQITPITIAEKKAEFALKKIEVASGNSSLNQNRETAKLESPLERPGQLIQSDKTGFEAPSVASRDQGDQFRRSFQVNDKKLISNTASSSVSKSKINTPDSDRSGLDEMKKIRGELADAINKMKGSEEEKLAVISDNNRLALAPKGSEKEIIKKMSFGEKDRLDSYKDSLNNWESRLRTWQDKLSDHDVQANSRGRTNSEGKGDDSLATQDQSNPSNTVINSAKLSKNSAVSGSDGPKSEVATERLPGSENLVGEEGIVNSENLATLEKDSLKNFGIVTADSFIIKVRHKEKIYSVPVKTFSYEGKSIFVPLLKEKDRELSKIVYESPLFKDYRDYQVTRLDKLEKI